jgi:hypothetical protein
MIKIVYPAYPYKIRKENDKPFIFDDIRRQWVALTPEEWVRQNFLQYLVQVKKYPSSLIAVEKEIRGGELTRRCDIVAYDKAANPLLMAECASLPVKYLVITNGSYCFAFERSGEELHLLTEIPEWKG